MTCIFQVGWSCVNQGWRRYYVPEKPTPVWPPNSPGAHITPALTPPSARSVLVIMLCGQTSNVFWYFIVLNSLQCCSSNIPHHSLFTQLIFHYNVLWKFFHFKITCILPECKYMMIIS